MTGLSRQYNYYCLCFRVRSHPSHKIIREFYGVWGERTQNSIRFHKLNSLIVAILK